MKNRIFLALGITFFFSALILAEQAPQQRWAARYNGLGGGDDIAKAIVVDNSGNVYVTGSGYGGGLTGFDYATIKYDPNGTLLWQDYFNGPVNGDDIPVGLAVDSSGNVYVTGTSPGNGTGMDIATVKYNTNGGEIWRVRYNNLAYNSNDQASAIAVDNASGCVYVAGSSIGGYGNYDYVILRYRCSDGFLQWSNSFPGTGDDVSTALVLDNSSNFYVTGYSVGYSGNYDYLTLKYNGSLVLQWIVRHNGPWDKDDKPSAMAVDNSGNVYVTGYSGTTSINTCCATVKYNSSGTKLWTANYIGPVNATERAKAIAADNSGNVWVTGDSWDSYTSSDYTTIKYIGNQNHFWSARYDNPDSHIDSAADLAIDNAGNTYVTGYIKDVNLYSNYATVKYDPDGNQLWVMLYDNGWEDYATAITMDNSGNVYVTGYSEPGHGSSYDFATVKYSQSHYCSGPIEGDLNNDCKIDFEDFALFALHWLECNYSDPADCL